MGQTVSYGSNASDSVIDLTVAATVLVVQKCGKTVAQTQVIDVKGCANVTVSDIKMDQAIELDTGCIKNQPVNDEFVAAAVDQQVRNINSSLSLSRTDASNVSSSSQSLSSKVQSNFFEMCQKSLSVFQGITLTDCENVYIHKVDWEQQLADTSSCAMDNSVNVAEQQNMVDTLDQTAAVSLKSKKTKLMPLLVVMGLCGLLIFIVVLCVPKQPKAVVIAGGSGSGGSGGSVSLGLFYTGVCVVSAGVALATACVVGYPVSTLTPTTMFPYVLTIPTSAIPIVDENNVPYDPKFHEYQLMANTMNDERNKTIKESNQTKFYVSLGVEGGLLITLAVLLYFLNRHLRVVGASGSVTDAPSGTVK